MVGIHYDSSVPSDGQVLARAPLAWWQTLRAPRPGPKGVVNQLSSFNLQGRRVNIAQSRNGTTNVGSHVCAAQDA